MVRSDPDSGGHAVNGDAPVQSEWYFGCALVHPAMVCAAAVWWLNDAWGKPHFGNWLTGKLSDVACLCVFPVFIWSLLDGLGALLLGDHWLTRRRYRTGALYFCVLFTGGLFASINLWSSVGDQYRALWSALYGAIGPVLGRLLHASHTVDPSDLLALPALGVALWRGRVVLETFGVRLANP